MQFRLSRAEYDRVTGRAYVELRAPDRDGDVIAAVIFSFRTVETRSKKQIEDDLVRKARHILKRASLAT